LKKEERRKKRWGGWLAEGLPASVDGEEKIHHKN